MRDDQLHSRPDGGRHRPPSAIRRSASTASASLRSSPRAARPSRCSPCPRSRTRTTTRAPTRSSSFGTAGKPLEIWLHWLALLPAVDPYLATAVSLARSALGGAGSVMVHYTRAQGLTDYVTEAKEVARAARDVGVRVGFAPALRDRNPLVYGPSEPILAALPLGRAQRDRAPFHPHAAAGRRNRSRWSTRSRRPARARPSTCSTARPPCNGARPSCCRPSRRPRRVPAAASTCTSWKRATSANGRTANFPDGIVALSRLRSAS